ncbi:MAG: hypothetical protein AAGF12_30465 [Myxococcota bacterium]
MLVECGHCGAPLDIKENVRVVKCRYCGTKNRVGQTAQLSAQTPQGWVPPTAWTPPENRPAESKPLPYHSPKQGRIWISLGIIAVVGSLVGYGALATVTTTTGDLATVDPEMTPAEVATAVGGTVSDDNDSVWFKMRNGPYGNGYLAFTEGHLSDLILSSGDEDDYAAHLAKLRQVFGQQLTREEDGVSMGYPNARLALTNEMLTVSGHPHRDEGSGWKVRLSSLVRLVLHLFADGPALSDADLASVRGSTFADLLQFDVTRPLEGAQEQVHATFPTAAIETSWGLEATIALRHPFFSQAELGWENAPGSRPTDMDLVSANHSNGFGPNAETVVGCLNPVLGEATSEVTDYMANRRDYQWTTDAGDIRLFMNRLRLPLYDEGDGELPHETLAAVLTALDGCAN